MAMLHVNGKAQQLDVTPDTPLLGVLRDALGMTGPKFGCGMALCGACTVHIDGQPTRSCVTPISALANKKVVTIEAIGTDKVGKAVRSEEHTSELQSLTNLVCRLLLEKKKS